mgnify:CR=1 FL=1
MAFQIPAPSVVYSRKVDNFILARPAGMEISWRTAGIRRPIKVESAPVLVKVVFRVLNLGFINQTHVPEAAVREFINQRTAYEIGYIII